MNFRRILVSIVVVAGVSLPASATLTTYNNESAFLTAADNQTFQNITFPSGSEGTSYTDLVTSTTFVGNLQLSGIASPAGWPAGTAIQEANCATNNCSTLTITLSAAVTAFELYYGTPTTYGNPTVTISNGIDSPAIFSPGGTMNAMFLGVVSDHPITTFTIQSGYTDLITLDDVKIGTPMAETPEVGTMLLIGTGLIMLRFLRRRLPKRVSTPRHALREPVVAL